MFRCGASGRTLLLQCDAVRGTEFLSILSVCLGALLGICAEADDVKWRCVRKCRFRAQWEPFLKCAILNSPPVTALFRATTAFIKSGRHSMELSVTVLMIQGV